MRVYLPWMSDQSNQPIILLLQYLDEHKANIASKTEIFYSYCINWNTGTSVELHSTHEIIYYLSAICPISMCFPWRIRAPLSLHIIQHFPNTLALTPFPIVDRFNLWYRPIFGGRRLIFVRLLTEVS